MSAMQRTTQPANGVTPARGAAQARSAPEGAVVGKPTAARRTARKDNGGFSLANFLANAGLGKVIVEESPDAHIFSQGDAADAVFYIQKGRVKLSVVSKQGKEAVIALLGPGEFVGEACIASGHPVRLTTATALSECVLLKISRKEMARVLGREHALSDVFVSFLLARNARIQADVVDQLFSSSEKRLARVLLLLAQFGKEGKPETIVPKLSQETLAEMVGTTRSRISFFMNRFRKMGFIEYKGEMRIHSSLLNVVLHD
jgi:CRP/FNR family cyclic AMP-dependent transcriptional regulator